MLLLFGIDACQENGMRLHSISRVHVLKAFLARSKRDKPEDSEPHQQRDCSSTSLFEVYSIHKVTSDAS